MYSDHFQKGFDFGHGLLIFLILAPIWLSETGQMCSFQAFSWQYVGGTSRNLACSSLTNRGIAAPYGIGDFDRHRLG